MLQLQLHTVHAPMTVNMGPPNNTDEATSPMHEHTCTQPYINRLPYHRTKTSASADYLTLLDKNRSRKSHVLGTHVFTTQQLP